MAKCKICGKKGLFLKVNDDGVCKDCIRLADIEKREKAADLRLSNKEKLIRETQDYALGKIEKEILEYNSKLKITLDKFNEEEQNLKELELKIAKSTKNLETQSKKVQKLKELYKALEYSTEYFSPIPNLDEILANNMSPTVQVPLNCLNYKDLRKKFNDNDKNITLLTEKYESRYQTKTIATVYKLMVIALRAELQNILTAMKFGSLDKAISQIKVTTSKYSAIASEGNQTIVSTLTKFIGEIEYLFIESAKIEYEYFIQKEQIKEEQRALREQLKQEALERKLLEQQEKQVAKEEEKYKNEIETLKEALKNSDAEKEKSFLLRIQELEEQLKEVDKKKEEIAKLQHGKAGYVYVISNLGSFGDNVFKIGMTRRLEPQERIDELGSASVPFPFDVHSFIFSNDAPELENNLHKILNSNRVNKVNYRKEFFRVSLDELEKIVYDLQPTAEFNRTMLAEQYNQSLSIEKGIADAFEGVLQEIDDADEEFEQALSN